MESFGATPALCILFRFLISLVTAYMLLAGSDAAINARLKAKLIRSKLHTDPLTYSVRNGVVEWTGSVSVPQRKGTATRMAKSAGATQVVNRIAIQSRSTTTPRRVTVQVPKPR